MKVCIVTGSRADYGMLEWLIKTMREDAYFDVSVLDLREARMMGNPSKDVYALKAMQICQDRFERERYDVVLVLGDRFEIFGAATAAYLARIPLAHIAGGDVTEGSYDDAMRDCISRMSSIHFVTSSSAMARLTHMGCNNIHLVGSPGIDYRRKADWKRERPYAEPYGVVSYQAETIDGTNEIEKLLYSLPSMRKVFILPNADRGSEDIKKSIVDYAHRHPNMNTVHEFLPHDEFLNLICHCDEFIGNSSAILYEAPELKVKTRMIGKRQRGRTIPMGDGNASERIIHILKYSSSCSLTAS